MRLDDACHTMHTVRMTAQRIIERILIGLAIGVGRNQINGAINRRRQAKGSYKRPGLPRNRVSIGPVFWLTFFVATTLLIIINH